MPAPTRRRGRPPGRTGADLVATAREVFLEHGYGGTTMDEVAARAQISKASLYREHQNKDALFAAVVRAWADAGRDAMRPHLERLAACRDVREGLVELAGTMRAGVLSPAVLNMRRLVTSEARRLPDVAADYLEHSWERNIRALAETLAALGDRGLLRLPDPLSAADQFTWLVIGSPLNRRLLTGSDAADAADAPVDDAVDLFLARYGT
ncbi:TetR/AcrR family transcriptional regulator [Glycomyces algeriensis]|uniref:TetR family transcriptional regulator n=1 Tax=Glycomyces algeriensis TaxID=256037 RepID=A0A9W6GCT5_9ACTN|nr:TetR/AcrR family transcriptional regulator [Glycomyces algeriensis]MDA1367799.1 TetR/AcrR family transcriptional regulator [Glycomyces algeriensis]MDR7351945.1 TetR/AcrR family transcriptional repressor of mexJK operon [Glycomyces algeriensis]GLI44676.1 TetR family transcriptional regulator [Glycomyces algeriensis]